MRKERRRFGGEKIQAKQTGDDTTIIQVELFQIGKETDFGSHRGAKEVVFERQ
jgi:hypothetical protein